MVQRPTFEASDGPSVIGCVKDGLLSPAYRAVSYRLAYGRSVIGWLSALDDLGKVGLEFVTRADDKPAVLTAQD